MSFVEVLKFSLPQKFTEQCRKKVRLILHGSILRVLVFLAQAEIKVFEVTLSHLSLASTFISSIHVVLSTTTITCFQDHEITSLKLNLLVRNFVWLLRAFLCMSSIRLSPKFRAFGNECFRTRLWRKAKNQKRGKIVWLLIAINLHFANYIHFKDSSPESSMTLYLKAFEMFYSL